MWCFYYLGVRMETLLLNLLFVEFKALIELKFSFNIHLN